MSNKEIIEIYLSETVEAFRSYKKLAERAMEPIQLRQLRNTSAEICARVGQTF
jgi:hypothetical protein